MPGLVETATAVLYVIGFIARVGRPRQTVRPWRCRGGRGAVQGYEAATGPQGPPPLFATPSDLHAAVIAGTIPCG